LSIQKYAGTINIFAKRLSLEKISYRKIPNGNLIKPETVEVSSHDYAHTAKTISTDRTIMVQLW